MIDTFSANSLKILDRSLDEFIDKFVNHLSLYKKDERAVLGQKYHSLICQYLKGYDISKMKKELTDSTSFDRFIKAIKPDNFIKTEYPFLIKDEIKSRIYYLTGRFDAVYKDEGYIIYDWKTLNLPNNAQDDLQTIVYLYCASEIFNTKNIKIRYVYIEFKDRAVYKKRIDEIVEKYYITLK